MIERIRMVVHVHASGCSAAGQRLRQLVPVEQQHREKVRIDLGEGLVGDLNAQGAPDYRRPLALSWNLGTAGDHGRP